MNDSENIIEIKDLKKSFGKLKVIDGLNLSVKKGSIFALLGPNGAGKTTTIRILSTLLPLDSGSVTIGGFDITKDQKEIRHLIGLTGQYAAVDEQLSGYENLVMIGRLYHLSVDESKKRATELLNQFDLLDASKRLAKQYSGGMRRRLDLAASLVATPKIIFLDEPTTGLDPRSRMSMWKAIEDLRRINTTIVLTTQYLEEADKLADKIAVLDNGKIIAFGTSNELKAKVGNERIEVVIDTEVNFKKALLLIKGDSLKSDAEERSISLSTDGSVREVKRVLDVLYESKIEIDSLSVHKPSLDDVFMGLTGHGTVIEKDKNEIK